MTKIENIVNLDEALNYFYDRLNWPISQDSPAIDPYEINWEYYPEDLGLKDSDFAKITTLQQMKPLKDNQDWAVFFVEFDYKKMQITVLRKILGSLIYNKRGADHKIWNMENLLFVCFWGDKQNRTIGFIHFNQSVKGLPTLKALYFEPFSESKEKLLQYENCLSHLKWEYSEKCDAWTAEWKKAFTTEYGQVIRDTTRLTKELAHSALVIRKQILEVLEVENENGYVHRLLKKFKDNLVHDMDEKSFADMYAQTICYGLFSARCLNAEDDIFDPIEAIDNIPDTNPFLRQLLKEGLNNQNGNVNQSISFDELELNNLIELLQNTDIQSIVNEFNRQTRQGYEDPVIHFYEDFLKEYDKDVKIDRGVFYTPLPVVNFIVKSVDQILQTKFGVADGLACNETYPIITGKGKNQIVHNIHKVQILDPATGTGTFLRQTVLQIKKNFDEKHNNFSTEELAKEWNKYVILSLLHRIYGFELMMAPYAVAHMKLAMALKDTGYNFESKTRLKVFLTNSLEEPGNSSVQRSLFEEDAIAIEATQANAVKQNSMINVVMGNPPYSGVSSNKGKWIEKLVEQYKYINGKSINERKSWYKNDYCKFIRYATHMLEKQDNGILAYINDNSYLDGPTFRGMRWNLLQYFDEIYILNLHGSSKRKETDFEDENVFDIRQGVCINIFVKNHQKSKKQANVYYTDLTGLRETKFKYLNETDFQDIDFKKVNLQEPFYVFSNIHTSEVLDDSLFNVNDLFPESVTGVQTSRDDLVVDFNKKCLLNKILKFTDKSKTDQNIRDLFFPGKKVGKYLPGDSRGWSLSEARKKILDSKHEDFVKIIYYRPFDNRYIYYSDDMIDWSRRQVMKHMLNPNYSLIIGRQGQVCGDMQWNLVYIADGITDLNLFYRGGGMAYPLYIYDDGYDTRHPNLDVKIVETIEKKIGITIEPLILLDYIYAILHTPKYRTKYKEFLKIDFPRIPYPMDKEQFLAFAKLGRELRELHLMKSSVMDKSNVNFSGDTKQSEEVTLRKWENGKVWINKTEYFEGIPESIWKFFIGGYQVADKWLKDRKGRSLSEQDILHYKRIIMILVETERIMKELDSMWNM